MTKGNSKKRFQFELSKRGILTIVILSIIPWILLTAALTFPEYLITASSPDPVTSHTFYCKPGPWGQLECTKLLIEPPEEFISSYNSMTQSCWILKNYSEEKYSNLLKSAELSASQHAEIQKNTVSDKTIQGFIIKPDSEFVWNLTPKQRSILYSALSEFPENRLQHEPACISTETAEEWFTQSGISTRTLVLFKHLTYQRDHSLLFSDLDLLLPLIPSLVERHKLVKALLRKETLLIKLRVTPDSDLAKLSNYWGTSGRSRDIYPLLSALSKVPEGRKITISSLLPPFARLRLYTYPTIKNDLSIEKHDCLWTAVNFFNKTPDDHYTEDIRNEKDITSHYSPVEKDPLFGDIILMYNSQGHFLHAGVFIADNIVFTKMGSSQQTPWIFMTQEDMMRNYPSNSPLIVRTYRQKKDLSVVSHN